MNFSQCSASLGYISWRLVNAITGATEVPTNLGCDPEGRPDIPAGQHRLIVSRNGYIGTYKLSFLIQPPPDMFDMSLPFSAGGGQPSAGAGDLETTASNDVYSFSAAAAGGLQIEPSGCSSSLGGAVDWKLIDVATGAVKHQASGCVPTPVPSVPAGSYKLDISRLNKTGTYSLTVFAQPPPQVFSLTSPASVADGVPAPGAGNLETTASEDHYEFTTSAVGWVRFNFSECSASLGYIAWKLVNATTGATEVSTNLGCDPEFREGIAAGQYRLIVSRNRYKGTYKLAFSSG